MGNIEIELFAKETPKTVKNFVELAKKVITRELFSIV